MKISWKKADNRIEVIDNIVLVCLIIFGLFLHCYRLGSLPRGLYVDEMGMAYDAWSLGHFGVDRYLKSWPVYLTNFGGGQSILYCYLDIPFILLGGMTPYMIRMPALIFSLITGAGGFFLIKNEKGKRMALYFLALFCLVPYFTIAGRIALDCNLMLRMCVLILLQLSYILKKDRMTTGRMLLLGVTIGVTFYSYALAYLIVPVFWGLTVLYLMWCRKIRFKEICIISIPAVVVAIPLVIVQVINIFDLPEMHLGIFTFTKLIGYRGGELTFGLIKDNLRWLYVSLFKADITEFDNFMPYSNLYIISIPLLIIGTFFAIKSSVKSIKERELSFDTIIVIFVGVICLISLIITGVTTYRINAILIGLMYLIILALSNIEGKIKYLNLIIIAVYLVFFINFGRFYFTEYEYDNFPQRLFAEDMTDALATLEKEAYVTDADVRKPLCVMGVDEGYVYYLSSLKESPFEYDVNQYGNNGDGFPDENGNIDSGRVAFWLPDGISEAYNYILYCPDEETLDVLRGMEYNITEVEDYTVAYK